MARCSCRAAGTSNGVHADDIGAACVPVAWGTDTLRGRSEDSALAASRTRAHMFENGRGKYHYAIPPSFPGGTLTTEVARVRTRPRQCGPRATRPQGEFHEVATRVAGVGGALR